jgi:hypothetical protein
MAKPCRLSPLANYFLRRNSDRKGGLAMSATLKQAKKILSIFEEAPKEQLQAILGSGLLADLRDCDDVASVNRDSFREFLGLTPLSPPAPKPIERIRVISATTIMVNLDAPPILPFGGAKIEFQIGSGWVKLDKRPDGLYVDDRKVILSLSEKQKEKKVLRGHELREELSGKPVLHPNIMDALVEYSHLIPEDWKKDEKGNTRYIFFWAVIFRNADGGLFVRCFYFLDGRWDRDYDWLGGVWRFGDPAALLAS